MKLKSIIKVERFGILENYKPEAQLKPFNTFNLIYGWNGSGKTTLGRLLRCLETKCEHKEFENGYYVVELENGEKVTSDKEGHGLEIRVFNQDFISDNLNLFDAQTKPIIYISKGKVDEKKELDKKKNILKEMHKEAQELKELQTSLSAQIEKTHKDAGRFIKEFFLGTIYANVTYNKSTSIKIWESIISEDIKLKNYLLTDDELTSAKSYTIINSKKQNIGLSCLPQEIDIDKLSEIKSEICKLLLVNITSKVIGRLKEIPDIGDWVGIGLQLFKLYHNSNCEFCGGPLLPDRISALEEHYNQEYSTLINNIDKLIIKVEKGIRVPLLNESHLVYDELKKDYEELIIRANSEIEIVNKSINDWIKLLNQKKSNPFTSIETCNIEDEVFDNLNTSLRSLGEIIKRHNSITDSHTELAETAKKKIEYHFVCLSAIKDKLKERSDKLADCEKIIVQRHDDISSIKTEIKLLEDELKTDTVAIKEINDSLHKFLGRNEIWLERLEEGGYQLFRNGIVARNLSEGEKTAISLIYFFSKLNENDGDIKNLIIVLDDPISSFDSNHLFNASSYIRKGTQGAKQLFVLTHNFWFFKQIRDWMKDKNKKKDGGVIKSHFYITQRGNLFNATEPLTEFHSEYHHVFNSILEYHNAENINDSECFGLANSLRRMLEAFTSFKTPNNSGVNGALQLGLLHGLTTAQKERIYYFLNKYSHLDRIESFDNTIETLIEEGKNVVSDVLWLIKKVDIEHYNSMLEICGYSDKCIVDGILQNN